MLDLQEEALDQIALAVEREVTLDLGRCCSGRDDGDGALFGNSIAQRFCIVSFIAQDMFGGQVSDQRLSLSDVAGLAWCKDKPQRIAHRIDDSMDFGGQAAPRTADRASFRPPFLPAAC